MHSVSATDGKRVVHIGCYRDEATAQRARDNIKDFCPNKGNWEAV